MIKTSNFVKELIKNNLKFAAGVPDSLTKDLCFELENKLKTNHVSCSNEGSAIGVGIGYFLKEKQIPIIYMQNSGLGNAINPIISLAEKNVYKIPLFLIIGWRGEIGGKGIDEPQHIAQGIVTQDFLKKLNIQYEIINKKSDFKKIIRKLKSISIKKNKIVALLVRKNSFENLKNKKKKQKKSYSSREEILKLLFDIIPKKTSIVSTTGILSRELNELNKPTHKINNFMCVGGMGHAVSIASGIAKKTKKKILCFDGDGSIGMHLGALSESSKNKNLVHVVFNNESHESVGGQKTCLKGLKLFKIAKELGYKKSVRCNDKLKIIKYFKLSLKFKNSFFLEIMISDGHRKNISRPKKDLIELKKNFMRGL